MPTAYVKNTHLSINLHFDLGTYTSVCMCVFEYFYTTIFIWQDFLLKPKETSDSQ